MKTISIFLHGQQGDILEALSVMRYREELWGDAKIVWYSDEANVDLFKFQDIEVRIFPRGFGYPQMVIDENKKIEGTDKPIWEDWLPLVDANNHLNLEFKNNFPSLSDIDFGYFPAPHQVPVTKRHGLEYSEVSKKVFGVPDNYEWHPCLLFSNEEREVTNQYMESFKGSKVLFCETFAGSGQSRLSEEMIKRTIDITREQWPGCKFIFASHKFLRGNEVFPDWLVNQNDVFFCGKFTVRQCALIAEQCNAMISVSSGISVASSAWGIKSPPMLQFAGSVICSTKAIANGRFGLVTADDKMFEQAKTQYYLKLITLLNNE